MATSEHITCEGAADTVTTRPDPCTAPLYVCAALLYVCAERDVYAPGLAAERAEMEGRALAAARGLCVIEVIRDEPEDDPDPLHRPGGLAARARPRRGRRRRHRHHTVAPPPSHPTPRPTCATARPAGSRSTASKSATRGCLSPGSSASGSSTAAPVTDSLLHRDHRWPGRTARPARPDLNRPPSRY